MNWCCSSCRSVLWLFGIFAVIISVLRTGVQSSTLQSPVLGESLSPLPSPSPSESPSASEAPSPSEPPAPIPPCPARSFFKTPGKVKCLDGSPSPWKRTTCPDDSWYLDLFVQDNISGDQVFLDVGCNLGTDAVARLSLWGQHPGLTQRWQEELQRLGAAAGACRQNVPKPQTVCRKDALPGKRVQVFCVEPLKANVDALTKVKNNVLGSEMEFEVVHAAASNFDGVAFFPAGNLGKENGRMQVDGPQGHPVLRGGQEYRAVNVTTLDRLVQDRGLSRVDMLHVDAEGFDPLVLAGAQNTLGLSRVVAFEIHSDLTKFPWGQTRLASQVDMLDGLGFDCYWAGRFLQRLTGCWNNPNKSRERLSWSNAICVKRGDVWHAIFESRDLGV